MLEEKLNPEREQQLRIEIGLLEKQLIQLREGKKSNQNRTELEKEYQNKFQKIASSVANLTTEILISLQNLGYIIQEIK
jgi:hypothetical protein